MALSLIILFMTTQSFALGSHPFQKDDKGELLSSALSSTGPCGSTEPYRTILWGQAVKVPVDTYPWGSQVLGYSHSLWS